METTTKDATGMVVLAALEMIHHQIGIPFAKNVNALVVVMMMMMMMMMMMEMMVEMMKVDVNLPVILPMMPIVMMETTTKDATGMVVLAALEMIHHQIGISFAKNVNALIHLLDVRIHGMTPSVKERKGRANAAMQQTKRTHGGLDVIARRVVVFVLIAILTFANH